MTYATIQQLNVRVVEAQKADNLLRDYIDESIKKLTTELALTAAAIRSEISNDWTYLTGQQTTDEAEVASLLTIIYLTTTPNQEIVQIHNPANVAIRVAVLCITTNIGQTLTVPPNGYATFSDTSPGDHLRCISIEPFTAVLV